jgi:hypothetical protein
MSDNTQAPRSNSRRRLAAVGAAVPALMIALALPASAAELTPIAEVVDSTVADLLSTLGAVLDALGLAA